jgi:hypothetical protein
MSESEQAAKVHQALVRFFCAFSTVEWQLGLAVKVVFRIDDNTNGDVIVACLSDITRKLNAVWSGIERAKTPSGAAPDGSWKAHAIKTMKKIFAANTEQRVLLAHAFLEVVPSGRLRFVSMKSQGELKIRRGEFTVEQLDQWSDALELLSGAVADITATLSTFTYSTDVEGEPYFVEVDASRPQAGTAPLGLSGEWWKDA